MKKQETWSEIYLTAEDVIGYRDFYLEWAALYSALPITLQEFIWACRKRATVPRRGFINRVRSLSLPAAAGQVYRLRTQAPAISVASERNGQVPTSARSSHQAQKAVA
jgi:hypothetical protein